MTVRSSADLEQLRTTLRSTAEYACRAIEQVLRDGSPLRRLKFERLGCDPLDASDAQNIAEQIDQHATYEAALDALAWLMDRHPEKHWEVAPGAHGAGHDIVSIDRSVAAEVFAAVSPKNNGKLDADLAKIATFSGAHRYVFYRAPGHTRQERKIGSIAVISLGLEDP